MGTRTRSEMQTVILRAPQQRQLAKQLIDKAPADYVVTIREQTRSLDQSAKMWAMLSDVSRSKPQGRRHTAEVWKELMLHACGHATQFETGLDGQPFPVGFRSSKLTKAQMSELLEFIASWGSENGVVWSDEYRSAA